MSHWFAVLLVLAATGKPAVTNPGFEELAEQAGVPSGWSYTFLPDAEHLVRYERSPVAGDGRENSALSIKVAADHPSKQVAYNAHQDVTQATVGKTYRVSAKVRTKGLRTLPMIAVQCLDADGEKPLALARSPGRELTGDVETWQRVEAEVTVPEGTSVVRLRIGIPAEGNAGGTALIDDVEIVEIP